VTVEAESCGV